MSAPHLSGWHRYGDVDRVVDDERHVVRVRDVGDAFEVEDVVLRVADALGVERHGVRLHGRGPRVEVVGVVDEGDLPAELRQRVVEKVVRAAVERRRRDDVVAGLPEVQQRDRLGGLTARRRERTDAALERGEAIFEHGLGRVHDPRVDEARAPRARTAPRRARCRGTRNWWSGRSAPPEHRWRGRVPPRSELAWSRSPSSRTCVLPQIRWIRRIGRCVSTTPAGGHRTTVKPDLASRI